MGNNDVLKILALIIGFTVIGVGVRVWELFTDNDGYWQDRWSTLFFVPFIILMTGTVSAVLGYSILYLLGVK